MDTLDNILSDEDTAIETVAEQAPVETVEAQPRAPDGKFAPKGEESASPAPVEEPPFDHAAVKGERERRQAAERRATELEERLQALQNPPAEPTSIWEDDAKWQSEFGSQVVGQAVNQATFNARLDMSEMMVRQSKPDFEEVKAAFLQLAEQNPTLRQQALDDPHPWNKAYQIAQSHKAMQELGATDVESLRAKIREELQAEMTQTPAVNIPQSLAGSQSARSNAATAFRPPTLDEILGP